MTYMSDAYIYDSQEIPLTTSLLDAGTYASENMPAGWDLADEDGLTFTGVMDALEEAPQSHAEGRSARPPMPVWPVALIVAGLALMAFGWLMNDEAALFIYTLIHRS